MENRDESVTMLQELYQNADMGERGTELLIERSEDGEFTERMREYAADYAQIKSDARTCLAKYGESPREAGAMERSMMWMGVEMKTLMDATPSHMAEMLIQGSSMGIVKGEKNLNRNVNADREAVRLEERLIRLEQDYIDDMKKYLS